MSVGSLSRHVLSCRPPSVSFSIRLFLRIWLRYLGGSGVRHRLRCAMPGLLTARCFTAFLVAAYTGSRYTRVVAVYTRNNTGDSVRLIILQISCATAFRPCSFQYNSTPKPPHSHTQITSYVRSTTILGPSNLIFPIVRHPSSVVGIMIHHDPDTLRPSRFEPFHGHRSAR